MDDIGHLFDDAVALFREHLVAAVNLQREARSPETFTAAEREVARLTQAFAAKLTQNVLQQVSDDPERHDAALKKVQATAASRGIEVRGMGRRKTLVRTLGGQVVPVITHYAMAKPRGGRREKRGAQGTGVYPILDEIGIVGRSTPALRLLVSRTLCEANSVTSGRELLAATGVEIDHKAALPSGASGGELAGRRADFPLVHELPPLLCAAPPR